MQEENITIQDVINVKKHNKRKVDTKLIMKAYNFVSTFLYIEFCPDCRIVSMQHQQT